MKNRLVLIIFKKKKHIQLYWAFVFLILDRNMSTKRYISLPLWEKDSGSIGDLPGVVGTGTG